MKAKEFKVLYNDENVLKLKKLAKNGLIDSKEVEEILKVTHKEDPYNIYFSNENMYKKFIQYK